MNSSTGKSTEQSKLRLSLDAWAVIVALVLALAARLDILKKVPW